MRFQSHQFQPSAYSGSYGAEEEVAPPPASPEEESSGEMLAEYMPAVKSLLGLDDPREQIAKLESRLRTLKKGGAQAVAVAWTVGTFGNVSQAINKTESQLKEAKSQAAQIKTRDMLYTALAVTGVAAGSVIVVWLGIKAWGSYQQTKIQQEELKRLQAGG